MRTLNNTEWGGPGPDHASIVPSTLKTSRYRSRASGWQSDFEVVLFNITISKDVCVQKCQTKKTESSKLGLFMEFLTNFFHRQSDQNDKGSVSFFNFINVNQPI